MREEYKAIVDAGFLLQIDDPFLVTYYITRPDSSIAECRKWASCASRRSTRALAGIPADRVRFHTCYSINMGPRVHDMQLKDIVDIILKVRAGAYSFEAANPRHEHEWEEWKRAKTARRQDPDSGRDHAVDRAGRASGAGRRSASAGLPSVVGRERVIAGADCGFASLRRIERGASVDRLGEVQVAGRGARIASGRLWRRAA